MAVKILESTRIKPPPDSPNSAIEFSLPLTFYDLFWLKFPPVERLFFYNLSNSDYSAPAYFNSVILPKLKHSLSLALLHYLPLAGSLKWPSTSPKPIIVYPPNEGVPFTVAESDADFIRFSSYGEVYEAVELHPLKPQLITSDDSASLIALQITLFPNQGFCIGIAAHHAVLDGKATTTFMKSWAYLCKHQDEASAAALPPELTPFFDRSVINKDVKGLDLETLCLNQWTSSTNNKSLKLRLDEGQAPNLVRATFNINREDFNRMRERVLTTLNKSSSNQQLHLSSFVLTLAYVATCMVKAKGAEGNRNVVLIFAADCRSRLDPPIPETYFGNCNTSLATMFKAEEFMNEEEEMAGFAYAAQRVSDMAKELIEKGVEGALEKMGDLLRSAMSMVGSAQFITVAGSPRFDVYETDLGWGKPCRVEIVSIDRTGAISMAESRDGSKGVEVGLALNKHELERFSSMFLKDIV